eukprot:scaffold131050_cov60-Phaeocystis_antarctica.AAC.2
MSRRAQLAPRWAPDTRTANTMPSEQELKKAFAMFDRNGDGLLSLEELKAILCLPTPGRTPLSEAKVEEIMKECDTNGDGQLSMEELAAGWADLGIGALLASAKSPPPSFAALIAAGTVVPDECEGPYALGSYHTPTSPVRIEGTRPRRALTSGTPPTGQSWRGRRAGPPSTLRPRTPSTPSTCLPTVPSPAKTGA